MYTLGFHNSLLASAALFKDDILLGAVSEERLNRIKNSDGIPVQAISWLLESNGIELDHIDHFCYGMFDSVHPSSRDLNILLRDAHVFSKSPNVDPEKAIERIQSEIAWNRRHQDEINQWFDLNNIHADRINQYDHHKSHAAGALFTSPHDPNIPSLVFVADGKGSFKSSSVFSWDSNNFKLISSSSTFNSLGYFYGTITQMLGFKPWRHEGKVTGLAAHGDVNNPLNDIFEEMISVIDGKICIKSSEIYLPWFVGTSVLSAWNKILTDYTKEDIACAAQNILEKTLLKWITYHCNNFSSPVNICVSGGIFANVKANQYIKNLDCVSSLFVMPAMGDAGIAIGSCLLKQYEEGLRQWSYLESMAIGPKYKQGDFVDLCSQEPDIEVTYSDDIVNDTCTILDSGKIIGYFEGSLEFGPRALCHRSILANARKRNLNDTLNKRLCRSEFMPFAPVTTNVLAPECFKNFDSTDVPFKFMTCTVEVTDEFERLCPAAVHIDNTARPQIVDCKSHPFVYSVITAMHERYGDLSIINTSFNLHEEPIVCTPFDAIKALKQYAVDCVIFENMIISVSS